MLIIKQLKKKNTDINKQFTVCSAKVILIPGGVEYAIKLTLLSEYSVAKLCY